MMSRKMSVVAFTLFILIFLCTKYGSPQTTNGLITGVVTDSSGAVVPGAEVGVTNPGTGLVRTASSGNDGSYQILQLPPGTYNASVKKQGFATVDRPNIQLEVNQSVNLNFKLTVSSAAQTVTVTGGAPAMNTTSATLSAVINHDATVDLPLNGREFTQLTLLTPGAAPVQDSQQTDAIALGAGGISPSVNGQRGEQNNFTMDGVLNNSIFLNTWAIAPPPDALQEFNVQSHITDAQFSISSGANINVVSRSGTNTFHGALWEFLRNDALDAQTFPETERLPYRQNQYGVYFGGPVWLPHIVDGRNNTWFSLYWEGFRSNLTQAVLTSLPTAAMDAGDFSGVLGAQVGTDSLGRPEYANEIYDPLTSRPDPANPGAFLRDPFPNNTIPANRLNPSSLLILQKYYPLPNLNVPAGVLPNYVFNGNTTTASDVFGIRMDHQFTENDTVFARFNRSNQHLSRPSGVTGGYHLAPYSTTLSNYVQQAALGYTHIFNPKTILNFRYGYTYTNYDFTDPPSGAAFNALIPNFTEAAPAHEGVSMGPSVSISNGYNGVSQFADPFGPQEGMDYHLDLTKVVGHHSIGVGVMYYHIRSQDDGWLASTSFTQNGTAQYGQSGPTGYGPASFDLGVLNSYGPWIGNTAADQTVNWWGLYAQDQWQVTKNLVATVGLRWDYVAPPNYHKIVSGLNALTGQFIVTGPVPPLFPTATGPKGYFYPQYNGYEPRFGLTYSATPRSVIHGAFAILDDHNNTLVQENQGIRLAWPTGIAANFTSLDLGIPTTQIDGLPAASSILSALTPYASYGADPNNRIPYSMQFNLGVQQQLSASTVMKLDYVGSLSRHQYIGTTANTALFPGPGPISARQLYPQYGGPFSFEWNAAPGSYNALQAQLQKSLSAGLFFLASYTWSKSMDWQSDPYGPGQQNFYDLAEEWGPSAYSLKNMFVFSGVYALPVGKEKKYLSNSNRLLSTIAGNWNVGTIITLDSGLPFTAYAGGDVANTGNGGERANRIGTNPYASSKTHQHWLNNAAFAVPSPYTYGNESRNNLLGPSYKNIDFNVSKNFPLFESTSLQFRSEFFNFFNQTHYSTPDNSVQDSTFGQILSASYPGREIQFALKLLF
jgi:hypothetical protein